MKINCQGQCHHKDCKGEVKKYCVTQEYEWSTIYFGIGYYCEVAREEHVVCRGFILREVKDN